MSILQHKHGGIVLAAGASSRMGRAKALLPMPSGHPLAAEQADRLCTAGAADVVIVLGHDAESIATALEIYNARIAYNADWASGRLSSLQTGLVAMPSDLLGALIVPVDAAHIATATFARVLHEADRGEAAVIRPCCEGKPGHVLWLARSLFDEVRALTPDPDFRFDRWIAPRERRFDIDDPAILNNINTPDRWTT
jgi:CTP:molybdopterin cytidylyltransferase MocA